MAIPNPKPSSSRPSGNKRYAGQILANGIPAEISWRFGLEFLRAYAPAMA